MGLVDRKLWTENKVKRARVTVAVAPFHRWLNERVEIEHYNLSVAQDPLCFTEPDCPWWSEEAIQSRIDMMHQIISLTSIEGEEENPMDDLAKKLAALQNNPVQKLVADAQELLIDYHIKRNELAAAILAEADLWFDSPEEVEIVTLSRTECSFHVLFDKNESLNVEDIQGFAQKVGAYNVCVNTNGYLFGRL
jgi:hypothetical protein